MIKAILFDLDGTLLNTNQLIYNSFNYILNDVLKVNVSSEEINKTFGKPLTSTFMEYSNEDYSVQELIELYRKYNLDNHDSMCKAFDGVEDMLMELKKRSLKTAIVTSKLRPTAERGLRLNNLLEYFDVIISPEDTKKHKPNAEPALKACELLHIEPSETIMVGDSSYDLLCGKAAGCYTCGVYYTAIDINVLLDVKPTYMIHSPMDILDII